MKTFPIHTIESAPDPSKTTLRQLQSKFNFLPNVLATMADNPNLLNGFVGLFGNFHGGSFNECERQILLLTNAVTIGSAWTIAAHSHFALEDGVPSEEVEAIKAGRLPKDPKYAALSKVAKLMIEKRGNLTSEDVDSFLAIGYSQEQLLEVIASGGISVMTAATANLAHTPIEDRLIGVRL